MFLPLLNGYNPILVDQLKKIHLKASTKMELKQHSSHETAWRWGGVWLRKTNFGIVPDSFLFFFGFFILNSKTAYWTLAGQTKSRHRSACQDSRWLVVGSSSHYWSVDSSLFWSYLSLGLGKDRVAVLGWYFKVYDLWARCFLQEKVPPPTLLLMIPLECSNPIWPAAGWVQRLQSQFKSCATCKSLGERQWRK